jgi:hypothetical protein
MALVGLMGGCDVSELLPRPADPAVASAPAIIGLTRSHCVGCPTTWTVDPCEFHDALRRTATGAAAARCAVVIPRGGERGLAEDTPAQVADRLAEAEIAARARPADAVLLYAFGLDLCRLGTAALWSTGTSAQEAALTALEAHKGDDRWPRQLLDLVDSGLAPIRSLDMALLERAGRLGGPGKVDLVAASKASKRALQASGADRLAAAREVVDVLEPDWDLEAQWLDSEVVRTRAIRVGLDGALRSMRRCPRSIAELTPGQLTRAPEGWSLDVGSCRSVPPPVGAAPEATTPTDLAIGGRDH